MKRIFTTAALLLCLTVLLSLTAVFAADTTAEEVKFVFGTASGRPGDTVEVKITIESGVNANSLALSGFTYDSEILEFVKFSDLAESLADNMIFPLEPDKDKMAITIPLKSSMKYSGDVCSMYFKIKDTAPDNAVSAVSAKPVAKNNSTELAASVTDGSVTVDPPKPEAFFTYSQTSGRPGETVKVVLSLTTEREINTIAISDIVFNTDILTFEGFSDYEAIEELTVLPPSFDEEKMAIVIGFEEDMMFSGDICTLNFKINENAQEADVSDISSKSVVKLDSVKIGSEVTAGGVTVYTQILGDIDGSESVDIDDAVLLFQYSVLPDLYPINYIGSVDFNKDGNVDIDDAILLFQYSVLPDLYPIG